MKNYCLFLLLFLFVNIPLDGQGASDSSGNAIVTINKNFMTTPQKLQQRHVLKDKGGPTFSGSPSWKAYMAFLEEGFRACGLVDIKKDSFTYKRWFTSDDKNSGLWTLFVDGKAVPVASYWAYSGTTGEAGVRGPLVFYDRKNPPPSIEGKIVVFEIPALPDPLPAMFKTPAFEYFSEPDRSPTDLFTLDQWYQSNYVTRFSGFSKILLKGKAAAALLIFNMGPARAAGLYTFPLTQSEEFGIPGLYLDRIAGKSVRQAAAEGRTATLKLVAKKETSESFFLCGSLPGKNYGKEDDEAVLLITHTDGPNISQENGALGILSVIEYFSRIPLNQRSRSLLVVLDPQHYMPRGHQVDWFALNPTAADKIVACLSIEHLGQLEYMEKGNDFLPTGRPELTQFFVQDNDLLVEWALKAVKDSGLPRTLIQCPTRKGQGRWYGMGEVALKRHIPGYGISGNMAAYWSTEARIDKFDKDLMWQQLAVAVRLTAELMQADLKKIAVPSKKNK